MAKLLETANFYGVLFSTNFMQVKTSSHLQAELVPDMFQLSSSQIVSQTHLVLAAGKAMPFRLHHSGQVCDTSMCT